MNDLEITTKFVFFEGMDWKVCIKPSWSILFNRVKW